MKIKNLLFATICGLTLNVQSQSYTFSVNNGTYTNLTGSTSLNNGYTWDDPEFTIPIGFNFHFFDNITDELYMSDLGLGGLLTTNDNQSGNVPLLLVHEADLIDRAYDFNLGYPSPGSQSDISYLLSGTPGNRIFKLEWENAGFYAELEEDDVSTDYVNFQFWVYEGSNDFEIHFGPNSVTQPMLSFDYNSGPIIGFFPYFDYIQGDLTAPGIILVGNAATPTMQSVSSLFFVTAVNGVSPNGLIYKFTYVTSGTSSEEKEPFEVSICPNPAHNFIDVNFESREFNNYTVSILNIHGQIVKECRPDKNRTDISDLIPGMYFLRIQSDQGTVSKRLVKE